MARSGHLLIAARMILLAALLTACNGQAGAGGVSEDQSPTTDTASAGAPAAADGAASALPGGGPVLAAALSVGESAPVAGVRLTLQGVELLPGTDGTYYLVTQIRLENTGEKPYPFSSLDWFRLEAPDGRRYRPSRSITAQAGLPLDRDLTPGMAQEGWVGFAAPLAPGVWRLHVGPDGDTEALFEFQAPEPSQSGGPEPGESGETGEPAAAG